MFFRLLRKGWRVRLARFLVHWLCKGGEYELHGEAGEHGSKTMIVKLSIVCNGIELFTMDSPYSASSLAEQLVEEVDAEYQGRVKPC